LYLFHAEWWSNIFAVIYEWYADCCKK